MKGQVGQCVRQRHGSGTTPGAVSWLDIKRNITNKFTEYHFLTEHTSTCILPGLASCSRVLGPVPPFLPVFRWSCRCQADNNNNNNKNKNNSNQFSRRLQPAVLLNFEANNTECIVHSFPSSADQRSTENIATCGIELRSYQ